VLRFATHALVVGLSLLLCKPALSCQCGTIPPPAEALARAEHVFLGLVEAIDEAPVTLKADDTHSWSGSVPRITFRVGQRWKGAPGQRVFIHSITNCAYKFELGRSYLVFAERSFLTEALEATRCLPTAPRSYAAESIRSLGPPLKP